MPPAARVGDLHTCPMVTPGTPPIPHVGGPILPPGAITVLIGGQPAATVTNMCTCVGPPDSIVKGSATVKINFLFAARVGDTTAHGGVITVGFPTVMIGDAGGGAGGPGGGGGGGGANSVAAGMAQSKADSDSENNSSYANANAVKDAGTAPSASQPAPATGAKAPAPATPAAQTSASPAAESSSSPNETVVTPDPGTPEARQQLAADFYSKTGWPPKRQQNHIRGIDLSKPVEVVILKKGTVVKQWVDPKQGVGNYFDEDATPEELGICPVSVQPRELLEFVVQEDTAVLKSTAGPMTIDWLQDVPPIQVPGGAIQKFCLPSSNSMFKG